MKIAAFPPMLNETGLSDVRPKGRQPRDAHFIGRMECGSAGNNNRESTPRGMRSVPNR